MPSLQPSLPFASPTDTALIFRLYDVIRTRHVGRANAGRFRDLADEVGVPLRLLHSLIARMVVEFGMPVGTTSAVPPGAFLCITEDDFDVAAGHLKSRAVREFVRAARLLKMKPEMLFDQLRLEFDFKSLFKESSS